MTFLTTQSGQQWAKALAASDLDLSARLTAIAHAAYADKRGQVSTNDAAIEAGTDPVFALAIALHEACGVHADES